MIVMMKIVVVILMMKITVSDCGDGVDYQDEDDC